MTSPSTWNGPMSTLKEKKCCSKVIPRRVANEHIITRLNKVSFIISQKLRNMVDFWLYIFVGYSSVVYHESTKFCGLVQSVQAVETGPNVRSRRHIWIWTCLDRFKTKTFLYWVIWVMCNQQTFSSGWHTFVQFWLNHLPCFFLS